MSGVLALRHLLPLLDRAKAKRRTLGEVLVVPAANPIGLSQWAFHRPLGRREADSLHNFNRVQPGLTRSGHPRPDGQGCPQRHVEMLTPAPHVLNFMGPSRWPCCTGQALPPTGCHLLSRRCGGVERGPGDQGSGAAKPCAAGARPELLGCGRCDHLLRQVSRDRRCLDRTQALSGGLRAGQSPADHHRLDQCRGLPCRSRIQIANHVRPACRQPASAHPPCLAPADAPALSAYGIRPRQGRFQEIRLIGLGGLRAPVCAVVRRAAHRTGRCHPARPAPGPEASGRLTARADRGP